MWFLRYGGAGEVGKENLALVEKRASIEHKRKYSGVDGESFGVLGKKEKGVCCLFEEDV